MVMRGKSGLWATGFLAAVISALGACSGGGEEGEAVSADTLTRSQKDSIIATLPIPGAGAVGAALDAAEKARERAAVHDTLG
jgi:hypothetical protein